MEINPNNGIAKAALPNPQQRKKFAEEVNKEYFLMLISEYADHHLQGGIAIAKKDFIKNAKHKHEATIVLKKLIQALDQLTNSNSH